MWKLLKLKGSVRMKSFHVVSAYEYLCVTHFKSLGKYVWSKAIVSTALPRGFEQIFQFSSAASVPETPGHAGSSNDAWPKLEENPKSGHRMAAELTRLTIPGSSNRFPHRGLVSGWDYSSLSGLIGMASQITQAFKILKAYKIDSCVHSCTRNMQAYLYPSLSGISLAQSVHLCITF